MLAQLHNLYKLYMFLEHYINFKQILLDWQGKNILFASLNYSASSRRFLVLIEFLDGGIETKKEELRNNAGNIILRSQILMNFEMTLRLDFSCSSFGAHQLFSIARASSTRRWWRMIFCCPPTNGDRAYHCFLFISIRVRCWCW